MANISDRIIHSTEVGLPGGSKEDQSSALQIAVQPVACDALVLNALTRQSLMTVRSLGKQGLRVAALETPGSLANPTFASRWCQSKISCPPYATTRELLPYLDRLLSSGDTRVVIPTADSDVTLLRHYREQIGPRTGLAIAKESALAIAVNKARTLEIAQKMGMKIPRGILLEHGSEVQSALREIGLPAVIKPEESWLEREAQGVRVACFLVTTHNEAQRAVEELTRLGGRVLFQQFLAGRRESINVLYANGQMYARFAYWAKRTNPPLGGADVLRQSIALPPDSGEQAERLIREIELEGYSGVEFRRDHAGTPYLMEINPRLTASVEIAMRAGIDFPYLLYQWASGERIERVEGYRTGLWMRYLGGDIETMLASLVQRGRPGISSPFKTLFDFCASFFMPMRYDYLDWQDPLPAWKAAIGFPRDLWQQAQRYFSNRSN